MAPLGDLALLARAALPGVPVLNRLPGLRRSGDVLPDLVLTRHDVRVDRAHVAAYARLCGFGLREELPLTYPHLLAFGLHLRILADPRFPFPAVGTVHLENEIYRHRPVGPDERLQVTARPKDLRPHPKGRVFRIVTQVHSAGEPVWEEVATFLRPGRGDPDADPGTVLEQVPANGPVWSLPGDLGRRYAAVSGDRNPIHLSALTARPFGYRRPIAHGMWTKARCLAALEGRVPDAARVVVVFRKPVLLPGRVAFGSARSGDGYAFVLAAPAGGAPHLLGRMDPWAEGQRS